MFERSLY